jgi:hypothetical protein
MARTKVSTSAFTDDYDILDEIMDARGISCLYGTTRIVADVKADGLYDEDVEGGPGVRRAVRAVIRSCDVPDPRPLDTLTIDDQYHPLAGEYSVSQIQAKSEAGAVLVLHQSLRRRSEAAGVRKKDAP